MSPELAKTAMNFLLRTQIQGAEAPALMQVMNALQALAAPKPATPPLTPTEAPKV